MCNPYKDTSCPVKKKVYRDYAITPNEFASHKRLKKLNNRNRKKKK